MGLTRINGRGITRRIDDQLVVTITQEGVRIRGFRKQKGKLVTWQQIAALSDEPDTIEYVAEKNAGSRELVRLGAATPQTAGEPTA